MKKVIAKQTKMHIYFIVKKAWYKYSAFTLKLISNKEGFKKAGLWSLNPQMIYYGVIVKITCC